jgi:[phosphatase 2A protein]-leucine-carboxy methyltransferase
MGKDELRRIAKLELLDEMEEWRLLASHYCLAWAWINGVNAKESPFEAWKNLSKTDA